MPHVILVGSADKTEIPKNSMQLEGSFAHSPLQLSPRKLDKLVTNKHQYKYFFAGREDQIRKQIKK